MDTSKHTTLVALATGIILASSLSAPALAIDAPSLPSYGADLGQTSVSGLSSGGFMTAQFHVAYSSTLVGVGSSPVGRSTAPGRSRASRSSKTP